MYKRLKNRKKGFSLVELLIVIAIIGIIATIAIPILLSARVASVNEKARNSLRSVVSAEAAYYAAEGTYGTLAQLVPGGYLDARFVNGADIGQGIIITEVGADSTTFSFTCGNPAGGAYIVYAATQTGQITP